MKLEDFEAYKRKDYIILVRVELKPESYSKERNGYFFIKDGVEKRTICTTVEWHCDNLQEAVNSFNENDVLAFSIKTKTLLIP